MSYKVLLTGSAERDLEEIYDYIAATDTQGNADYVLKKLVVHSTNFFGHKLGNLR